MVLIRINFLFLFFIGFYLQAQEVPPSRYLSPSEAMESYQMNLKSYLDLMDNYWENTPHDFRGSGIKPYLRWKEKMKYFTKPNGELMSREEIRSSWQRVKQQRTSLTTFDDSSNWIPMGPFDHTNAGSWSSGQGRVNVSKVDPNNPNTVYIGTPDGGAWKSEDNGDSWVSIADQLPIWGVSGIAIDPTNSNIIYLSTGDEDGWNSYSDGVYKSTDGGANWVQLSGLNNIQLGEIYINPNDSNMLWVCSDSGLYRSVNGGNTWSLSEYGTVKEIRLKPNNPNILYIVKRNGSTVEIKKSNDAGFSFSTVKTYYNASRTVIDVTEANSEVLYVMVSNQDGTFKTLDKSSDSGITFTTQMNNVDIYESPQAYYDLAIAVSDTDENTVYTGCLNIWKSTNGGQNFNVLNSWSAPYSATYTHADIHDIKIENGKIYACTDGGIYISNNSGQSFVDKTTNGLNIGQFYRIDVAQNNGSQVVGGLQDNGGYVHTNNIWKNYYGADGMDCAISPINPNIHVGFIQYGYNLYYYNSTTGGNGGFVCNSPNNISGNWITPLEVGNQGTLYAGYNRLYKLSNSNVWELASPYYFADNIQGIRVSPDDDLKVLVFDGVSLYQSDGSQNMNFDMISNTSSPYVQCFDYNRNNSNIIYYGNYDGVFKSVDGGNTWSNFSQGLPSSSYKSGIIHQASSSNNTLYLATNNAVYYTNDDMSNWQIFSSGLPNSQIMDIEVNNVENSVLIATYGRGVWRSPVDEESLTVEDITKDSKGIFFYPNPAHDFVKLNVNIDEVSTIEVFNVNGEVIKTFQSKGVSTKQSFDISELEKGIYLIRLTSPTHLITKKIIKK